MELPLQIGVHMGRCIFYGFPFVLPYTCPMPYVVHLTAGSGGGPPSPLKLCRIQSSKSCPSPHIKVWGTRDRTTQFLTPPKNTGLHASFSSSFFFLRVSSMVFGGNYFLAEYSNFGGLQVAPRSPFRANLFDSIRHDWRENLQSPKQKHYHRRTSKVLRDLIMLIWSGKLNRSSRPQSPQNSTKR